MATLHQFIYYSNTLHQLGKALVTNHLYYYYKTWKTPQLINIDGDVPPVKILIKKSTFAKYYKNSIMQPIIHQISINLIYL